VDVPLRRRALDRRAALLLLLSALVAAAAVLALLLWVEGTARVVSVVVVLAVWAVFAAGGVVAWSRTRAIASPLGLHGDGVTSRSPYGELVVPWESVAAARIEGKTLRIWVRFGAPADHSRLRDAAWRTVEENGVRISLAALDVALEELRRAFTVQSSG
jgi:hypothetical protein